MCPRARARARSRSQAMGNAQRATGDGRRARISSPRVEHCRRSSFAAPSCRAPTARGGHSKAGTAVELPGYSIGSDNLCLVFASSRLPGQFAVKHIIYRPSAPPPSSAQTDSFTMKCRDSAWRQMVCHVGSASEETWGVPQGGPPLSSFSVPVNGEARPIGA